MLNMDDNTVRRVRGTSMERTQKLLQNLAMEVHLIISFRLAGLKVLVVDDDPTCLKILEMMLRSCGYEVTPCSRAVVALNHLLEKKYYFDLVLSDVHMPDMDGFKLLELIGLLKMDSPPVLMMSVDDELEVIMKGVTHGACDYLIKPIRIEVLKTIWQHVVRKRLMQTELKKTNLERAIEALKTIWQHLVRKRLQTSKKFEQCGHRWETSIC